MKRVVLASLMCCLCAVLVACGTAVPDVKGNTVAEAGTVLVAAGFKLGTVTHDEKAVEATGSIVTQTPEAGATAQAGSAVALTVAGAAPVPTPSLLGLDRAAAESALAAAGLTLGSVTESYDASAAAGAVASQTPAPGLDAVKGSSVAVVISKGPEPVAVPNVVGKTKADAIALLETAGFKVKAADKDNKAKKGTAVAQSPAAGKLAQPGSTVSVTVSTGVTLVRVPNLLAHERDPGWDASADVSVWPAALQKYLAKFVRPLGLTARVDWAPASARQSYQSPKAGAKVPKGTVVRYYLVGGE